MVKKPHSKILAALLSGALSFSLVACSNDDSSSSSPSSSASAQADDTGATEAPTVDRDPSGELPEVTFADGKPTMKTVSADPPTSISVKTLTEGDGETVQPGAYVSVNYAGFLWSDGTQFDSSFDRGQSTTFSLNQVVDGWKYGLEGTKVGDQVLVVVPPEFGYGDTDSGSIPGGSTLVFVVDVLGTLSPTNDALSGATATDAELPAGVNVAGDLGAEPTITFDDGAAAPTETQTVVLAEGTGAPIADTDTFVFNGVVGNWGDSATIQSTWPDSYQSGGGVPELSGVKVGSRVLLVYPADEASGTKATVMVIDIVGSIPSA